MLDRFLDWIEKRGGFRMIVRNGKPYLGRYYVMRTKYLTVLIHKIYASDPDDVHDHPWNNASLVLRHGYYEFNKHGEGEMVLSGMFKYRRAETLHRLVIPEGQAHPTYSMFFTGKRRRAWGFRTKDGWVAAKVYDRQPVDIEGRDFTVEGWFLPRVVWLTPR